VCLCLADRLRGCAISPPITSTLDTCSEQQEDLTCKITDAHTRSISCPSPKHGLHQTHHLHQPPTTPCRLVSGTTSRLHTACTTRTRPGLHAVGGDRRDSSQMATVRPRPGRYTIVKHTYTVWYADEERFQIQIESYGPNARNDGGLITSFTTDDEAKRQQ